MATALSIGISLNENILHIYSPLNSEIGKLNSEDSVDCTKVISLR